MGAELNWMDEIKSDQEEIARLRKLHKEIDPDTPMIFLQIDETDGDGQELGTRWKMARRFEIAKGEIKIEEYETGKKQTFDLGYIERIVSTTLRRFVAMKPI